MSTPATMTKEYKQGKWVLTHRRYVNSFSFEEDAFDLFDTEQNVHRPFRGFPKAVNTGKDFPINKIGFEYTEEDYKQMIQEQIETCSK